MAVNRRSRPSVGYGIDNALQNLAPSPIISQRAPTANDVAEISTTWIDVPNQAVYVLTDVTAGSANWATSPASGATTLASLLVTPGDLDVDTGDVTIAGTLDVTGESTFGDATIGGTLTFSGDLDLSSAALVDIVSTLDAAPSVLIEADGGTSEQVQIHSDQGTSVSSILLLSDVGGITLTATGLASADAINLEANSGGIDADAALQINIDSSQSASTAIRLNTSDAAGGIDIDSGTGGIAIDSTGAISVDGAAASNVSTSVGDLSLISSAGSVVITGAEAVADAVDITASNAAGGIQLTAGTNGISTVSTGGVDLASSLASNAAAVQISASAADSGVTIDSGVTPGCTFTNGTQSFQMLVGTGSPNGSVTAAQGSMYVDVAGSTSTTILFVNTDGSTTWVGVGA